MQTNVHGLVELTQKVGAKMIAHGAMANAKFGAPEDVAALALFLSGRGSNYSTGQIIAVDGGYTTTAVWPFEP